MGEGRKEYLKGGKEGGGNLKDTKNNKRGTKTEKVEGEEDKGAK